MALENWQEEDEEQQQPGGSTAPMYVPGPSTQPTTMPFAPGQSSGQANPSAPMYGSGYGDIDEMRADPYTGAFEQAAIGRADELAKERFKTLRGTRTQELARRGITPESGLFQREMGRIDADEAKESAGFRRSLQLSRVGERERRLGIARAIEYQLDQMERQRMADSLAMLSGNPDYMRAGADIGGNIASIASSQAMGAQRNANDMFGGAGELFGMLLGQQQRQPTTINLGGGSPTGDYEYGPPPSWLNGTA